MSAVLAVVAFVLALISLFDSRFPYAAIAVALVSLAVLIEGGTLDVDTD